MKKGDKCYIIVSNSQVHYNGYPVCLIREDKVYSAGKKFILTCEKDCFSGVPAKYPQFFTKGGYRNWTPKNIHDFYYDFNLLDEETFLKNHVINENGEFITCNGIKYIIR